jgi:hypothetical protein
VHHGLVYQTPELSSPSYDICYRGNMSACNSVSLRGLEALRGLTFNTMSGAYPSPPRLLEKQRLIVSHQALAAMVMITGNEAWHREFNGPWRRTILPSVVLDDSQPFTNSHIDVPKFPDEGGSLDTYHISRLCYLDISNSSS